VREEFEEILAAADRFTTTATPTMVERERLLDVVTRQLATLLAAAPVGTNWRAQKGGRHTSFGPVAWVRVYQESFSPRATTGFYLVYLFAADGNAVYLSLNQGTSERRWNRTVPMGDTDLLRRRSAQARRALADQEASGVVGRATIAIDLAASAAMSYASRKRVANYELANVYAIRYSRRSIPSDVALTEDLFEFLPSLMTLYTGATFDPDVTFDVTPPIDPSARRRPRRLLDSAVRHAIEVFAEDVAISYLPDWEVTRVGHLHQGYDLECRRGNELLHLEVKGTTTVGEEVVLTPNEVEHPDRSDCSARHGLFVVANLRVQRSQDGAISIAGGNLRLFSPWRAERERLTPSEFVYAVPPEDDSVD
jgi:hypothetical protein